MNLFKANVYRNKRCPMKPRNGKRWNYIKTNRKNYNGCSLYKILVNEGRKMNQ